MFQHARQRQPTADAAHARVPQPAAAAATVGKRTLADPFEPLGAPNGYARATEAARRELRAVRTVALPAYTTALRRTDLAPLEKQIEITDAALQLRHLLMTANQHVTALEKAATYRDALVVFLRQQLTELVTRARRIGAYRGAEDMIPRPHVQQQPQTRADHKVRVRTRTPTVVPSAPTPVAWTTASRSPHARR